MKYLIVKEWDSSLKHETTLENFMGMLLDELLQDDPNSEEYHELNEQLENDELTKNEMINFIQDFNWIVSSI